MQKDLIEGALKDIGIIKSSIRENKNPYINLCKFLLFIGIINLIYYLAIHIGIISLDIKMFQKYANVTLVLKASTYILLLIYFIRIYKKENKSLNTYYLGFLSIVAGIILFLPLLKFLIRVMAIFIEPCVSGEALLQLEVINITANILLFCFIIILCGFILRRQIMFLISATIFFIFLIITTFYGDVRYTFSFSQGGSLYLYSTYYSLVVSIGYIIIASVLKSKYKKVENTNGNS